MTPIHTTSKVLLLSSPRTVPAGSTVMPLRRFRVARLRLDGRYATGDPRFEQIRRS